MNSVAVGVVLVALSSPLAFSWSTSTTKPLAPGVTLTQDSSTAQPLLVNVITVDPSTPGVIVAPAIANGSLTKNTGDIRKGREDVSSLVARTGVLAAVNGDYFPYTGDPYGLGIVNGEIYSEPFVSSKAPGRAVIGWTADGHLLIGIPQLDATVTAADGTTLTVTGVNRLTATDNQNDLVICTSLFGPNSGARGGGTEIVLRDVSPMPLSPGHAVTGTVGAIMNGSQDPANVPPGGLVISAPSGSPLGPKMVNHFHFGDKATVTVGLRDITPSSIVPAIGSWNDAKQAIGGGPILLRRGQMIVDDAAEGFDTSFSNNPHARTGVGVTADGKIVIVTVDDDGGNFSGGISLRDFASLLQQLGAVDAINLDGGGSTTMVAGGMTVDYPSGAGAGRPVADMLTVNVTQVAQPTPPPAPAIGAPVNPQVGKSYPLTISLPGGDPGDLRQSTVWNGPAGGIGFVTQDGTLHVQRAGHGTITAVVGGAKVSVPIVVGAPGAPPPAPPVSPTPSQAPSATNSTTSSDAEAGQTR